MGKQRQHKGRIEARQDLRIVITLADQVIETRLRAGKGHGVGIDVGVKKGVHRLMIFTELDLPVPIVQVEHGVQRMEIG